MKHASNLIKIYFICLILFFVSCSSPQKQLKEALLSPDEYEWAESFFNELMLKESGIFTLWGSKPLVFFTIDYPDEKEEEEFQKWLKSLSEKDKRDLILSIKVEDKGASWFKNLPKETQENAVVHAPQKFPFYSCWEKWQKIKDRFPISKYLLVEKQSTVYPNKRYLFFVNIAEAFFVIQENYEKFVRKIGEEFDPLNIVFELENEASIFWQKALQDPELVGLLCGFGSKNASCYDLYSNLKKSRNEDAKNFIESLSKKPACTPDQWSHITPSSFPIPGFASFVKNDQVIEKYLREKEEIQKEYKNKDFVHLTIEKLTS